MTASSVAGPVARIVVADDSATARLFTRRCLEIAGCRDAEFVEVGDGLEALVALREKPTALLVTDLVMPKLGGLDLIRRLRLMPTAESPAIVVVTSAGNPAREAELLGLGVAGVVGKPVSPAKLAPVIDGIRKEGKLP